MVKKTTAAITAVGGYVPPDKLTNADLEKMVDTNDEWIRTRTGIVERRILKGEGKATSDLGAPAVLELCHKRGIDPKEIDCMICCTVTPDMLFPATANIICDKIGATNAFGFDLNAACSGFLFGVTTARIMLSYMKPEEITRSIVLGDTHGLEKIKGIGKKTAERLVLELKDKLSKQPFTTNISAMKNNTLHSDALNALMALGIARNTADQAIQRVSQSDPSLTSLEDVIKKALKTL